MALPLTILLKPTLFCLIENIPINLHDRRVRFIVYYDKSQTHFNNEIEIYCMI